MLKGLFLIAVVANVLVFASVDIEGLTQKAKSGDMRAIYQLGYIYENGVGVKVNKEKAYKLYKKAANLGSSDAKLSLELLSLDEEIVKKRTSVENSITIKGSSVQILSNLGTNDLKDIVRRAKKGDTEALYTLGVMYENGYGPIKQDMRKATIFYKKAAKGGSSKAIELLKLKGIQ